MASWNKLTYHRRLFLGLVVYSCLLVGGFAMFQYHRERQFKADELNARLQLINDRILHSMSGNDPSFDPASVGSDTFEDLRISIITPSGTIVYDNSLDSLPSSNHLDRTEIADAMKKGSGFTVRRHSASTGQSYFYSAKKGERFIVRTAVPYSGALSVILSADHTFLWFMAGITLVMCILGFFATRRVGVHISRLNRFAEKAERGERIYDTEPFPHDELGDISNHIVRLYARLQQAMADRDREHRAALYEQQEKIRIKRQLTNNINHELKTPVASMQVCLETLIARPDMPQEKRREFITRCHAACQRLGQLLTDVAQITRMEDGNTAIAMDNVDIGEIAASVSDEFHDEAEVRNVRILTTIPCGTQVIGNYSLLSSVFRNLISNALSYSGCDTIEIRILSTGSETVTVIVADNGCGVADEHIPKLFERFYRIDKGRSRQAGGTGLGLAIVKNAILLHGGNITVANRRGGGLLFTFTLRCS